MLKLLISNPDFDSKTFSHRRLFVDASGKVSAKKSYAAPLICNPETS